MMDSLRAQRNPHRASNGDAPAPRRQRDDSVFDRIPINPCRRVRPDRALARADVDEPARRMVLLDARSRLRRC